MKENEVSFGKIAALEEELHQLKAEQGLPEKEGKLSRIISAYFEKKEARQEVSVDRRKYLLVTLLTGWMGGHRFYTRQYAKGMLYLLFFWTGMPMAMTVIDLLVAIPKPVDENGRIKI